MAINHPSTTSVGSTAGMSHRHLSQPKPVQTSRPSSHSGRSSLTANDPFVYILRPTATVKRYERRVKLGNWLDRPIVPAFTTSFERWDLQESNPPTLTFLLSDKPRDWDPLIHPEVSHPPLPGSSSFEVVTRVRCIGYTSGRGTNGTWYLYPSIHRLASPLVVTARLYRRTPLRRGILERYREVSGGYLHDHRN